MIMIKALFHPLKLKADLEFKGDYFALKKHLETTKRSYNVEGLSKDGFKVYAQNSLGTFIGHSYGISGMVAIKSDSNDPLQLHFRTNLRIELIFVMIMGLVFFISTLAKGAEGPIWGLILPPVLVFLFWGWYRIQERLLLSALKKTLAG